MRILFMVPVYSVFTLLSNWYYWHSVYFQLISATYAAIAVTSYFALLCHYVAPYMHDYKDFLRGVTPKPWGNFFPIPIGWLGACCGGERGIWRTPRSGLTWFNVSQPSVHLLPLLTCADSMVRSLSVQFLPYCNVLVAATTQYFGRYCQGSVRPVFAHTWVRPLINPSW